MRNKIGVPTIHGVSPAREAGGVQLEFCRPDWYVEGGRFYCVDGTKPNPTSNLRMGSGIRSKETRVSKTRIE